MKKIIYLLLIIFSSMMIVSCATQKTCPAYGEKQRWQQSSNHWTH